MHLTIDMRTGRLSERGTNDTNVHNLLYKLMKPIHFTKTNPALVLLLAIRTNNEKVVEIVHMLMKSMTMTQRSRYTKGRWLQLVLYNRKRCAIFSHILTENYDNSYPEIPSTEAATWLLELSNRDTPSHMLHSMLQALTTWVNSCCQCL